MSNFYQTEKCFRRYEKIIAAALEKYPESVRFKSTSRSANTDSSRCGNAIAAYKRNRWPVANSIFDLIEERPLRTWIEKDYCVIGPGIDRDKDVQIIQGMGDGLHGALQAKPTSSEHVKQLMQLINEGVLTNPIEIPKLWQSVVETESAGMLNIAHRVETSTVILF